MQRTKTKERYITPRGTFEHDFRYNMYIVLYNPITYKTIKLERHEE